MSRWEFQSRVNLVMNHCMRAVSRIKFLQLENFLRSMACSTFFTSQTTFTLGRSISSSGTGFIVSCGQSSKVVRTPVRCSIFRSDLPLVFLWKHHLPHLLRLGCVSTDSGLYCSGFLPHVRKQMALIDFANRLALSCCQ